MCVNSSKDPRGSVKSNSASSLVSRWTACDSHIGRRNEERTNLGASDDSDFPTKFYGVTFRESSPEIVSTFLLCIAIEIRVSFTVLVVPLKIMVQVLRAVPPLNHLDHSNYRLDKCRCWSPDTTVLISAATAVQLRELTTTLSRAAEIHQRIQTRTKRPISCLETEEEEEKSKQSPTLRQQKLFHVPLRLLSTSREGLTKTAGQRWRRRRNLC